MSSPTSIGTGVVLFSSIAFAGLEVSTISSPPTGSQVIASQPYGRKGPTRIRYYDTNSALRPLKVSPNPSDAQYNGGKYWQHDRDIGQTFTTPSGHYRLDAITLRLGPEGSSTELPGALNAKVSLQLFKVTGTPVINNNGTTQSGLLVSDAYNMVPATMPMADDYITGETYTSLGVARGGVLPGTLTAATQNTVSPTTSGVGTYLRWNLTGEHQIYLEPNSVYAFMVMFDEPAQPGQTRGLPLDNWDYLNQSGVPMSTVITGPYAGGHAIRRAGSIDKPWESTEKLLQSFNGDTDMSASEFPLDFATRTALSPGTWGRPDVDTYRDLVFYIEADVVPEPALLAPAVLLLVSLSRRIRR